MLFCCKHRIRVSAIKAIIEEGHRAYFILSNVKTGFCRQQLECQKGALLQQAHFLFPRLSLPASYDSDPFFKGLLRDSCPFVKAFLRDSYPFGKAFLGIPILIRMFKA